MDEFNLEEWRRKKKIQEKCPHEQYRVELTETTNGNPLRRFSCVACDEKENSVMLYINDVDRKIASVKHDGKTLQEIFIKDAPYLYWVAVNSKMGKTDRHACARMCLRKPYKVPADGDIISKDEMYHQYVKIAKDFIIGNGGKI